MVQAIQNHLAQALLSSKIQIVEAYCPGFSSVARMLPIAFFAA